MHHNGYHSWQDVAVRKVCCYVCEIEAYRVLALHLKQGESSYFSAEQSEDSECQTLRLKFLFVGDPKGPKPTLKGWNEGRKPQGLRKDSGLPKGSRRSLSETNRRKDWLTPCPVTAENNGSHKLLN